MDRTLAENILSRAVKAGQRRLSEYEGKRLLAAYGIPTAREELIEDLEEAEAVARKIGYPVVIKACGIQVVHKTEQGLVEKDIRNERELKSAYSRLSGKVADLGAQILVQEMVRGSRELVAGLIRDPQFGPCVMFGLGGIFTEALEDVCFRVAPFGERDAKEMFQQIKGRRILEDFRGLQPVNLEVLGKCLMSLGRIGIEQDVVREIDVNPLIVRDGMPVAVDAFVTLEESRSRSTEEMNETDSGKSLDAFFQPRSVAVIGASQIPHKAGNDVVKNILANKFGGKLYLVNPKGGEILGHRVYRSMREVPGTVDLAVIVLPASATAQAIRDCGEKGVKAVVLAAGGFAEVDEEGKKLQREVAEAVHESKVRAIGPNTSGHISTPHRFTSSFFPLGRIPRGNISYIAQTGNFATHTLRYIMSAEPYGVARVMGLGNKIDVEESEVLDYYGEDPETKAIFLYLESFKRPRRFLEVARRVTRTKPVILLKAGSTPEGNEAAVAHTAALASDDRIIDGALRQAGVVRIYEYSHLFLAAKAISFMPVPRGNRVSFLAPSGAMLVSLTDLCLKRWSLRVPNLEETTRRYLQSISPPFIRMRNPVDIWPAAMAKGVGSAYKDATEAVLNDPNIDATVMILLITDETGVPSLDFIPELAHRHPDKSLYVTFTGQKHHMDSAKTFLESSGIPTFPRIEEPFEVLSILSQCRRAMEIPTKGVASY